MAFIDLRLDPAISEGAQGGPDWEPDAVIPLESGDESRENVKSKALSKWVIGYPAREPHIWQRFQDFWYIVGGRRDSWRFKDWLDYQCSTAESRIVAIDATHWQMYKRRSIVAIDDGDSPVTTYTYDQKIVLPYNTTVTGPATYTVGAQTGIITKTAGSGAPTSFVTEFDKLCRFDTPRLVQTIEVRKANAERTIIVSYTGIPVIEIPLSSA